MNRGGAEAMIMNLYRNIDREKVQFDFVENSQEEGIYENEILSLGGRIFHCPKFNGNVLSYMNWWNQFFDEHNNEYSFVHGHIGSTAAMYLSSAKRHGIKTIAHSHNTYTKQFSLGQFRYQVMSYPTRFIADYFFACSEEAGISRYGNKVSFRVIRNAIDTELYKYTADSRKTIFAELQINPEATVFGHVGRFNDQKNHYFLLDIFKEIHEIDKDAVLLLAGDGPLRSAAEKKAEDLGISRHVKFLGVREDIPALMSCMDVMIFPSLYEGLPVTLVEAQCSGLRCLISDRISEESVLTNDLITFMTLELDSSEWAKRAVELSRYSRHSYQKKISEAGYDIKENARWLQSFYLEGGSR
jgi:glycosyltransferase involved in cell wall biosynthesis